MTNSTKFTQTLRVWMDAFMHRSMRGLNHFAKSTGLSMPHSPRWHDDKLWVLDSGNGGLGVVDPTSGRYQEVCRLPGFTRGLDFAGPFAFVGLSQVRESAVFSGIAVAELKPEERA